MKYNDIYSDIKDYYNMLSKILQIITDKLGITEIFNFQIMLTSNNSMNNNIYAEPENSNIEYNKSVPMEDSKSYNNNDESNEYTIIIQQDTSSNPQGVIDSIAQEITSARLQQAIILSEIVGKPRSKTRRKRRF